MLNNKGTQEINTKRLLLRKIKKDDYTDMYRYTVKEDVARYVTWSPHKSIDDTKAICEMWANEYENGDKYHWAIVYDNRVIGNIEIIKIVNDCAYLGWQIDSDYWNMGIMTEAGLAVRDYMFLEIGIEKLCGSYIKENIGSGRVMEKIGMTEISAEEYYANLPEKEHELEVNGKSVGFRCITKEMWECLSEI